MANQENKIYRVEAAVKGTNKDIHGFFEYPTKEEAIAFAQSHFPDGSKWEIIDAREVTADQRSDEEFQDLFSQMLGGPIQVGR